jgi:hypothetical protein
VKRIPVAKLVFTLVDCVRNMAPAETGFECDIEVDIDAVLDTTYNLPSAFDAILLKMGTQIGQLVGSAYTIAKQIHAYLTGINTQLNPVDDRQSRARSHWSVEFRVKSIVVGDGDRLEVRPVGRRRQRI